MIKWIILLIMTFTITACGGGSTTIKVAEKTRLIPITINQALLEPCITPPPPDKEHYMSSNISERETLLAEYSASLIKNLRKCGKQIDEIKIVQEKAIKEIKEGN